MKASWTRKRTTVHGHIWQADDMQTDAYAVDLNICIATPWQISHMILLDNHPQADGVAAGHASCTLKSCSPSQLPTEKES